MSYGDCTAYNQHNLKANNIIKFKFNTLELYHMEIVLMNSYENSHCYNETYSSRSGTKWDKKSDGAGLGQKY